MSEFYLFFRSGMGNIKNIHNYQHIMFLISLFAFYPVKKWKKILLLITAFKVGHCISLAFIFIKIFNMSMENINFFIPVIILISVSLNFPQKSDKFRSVIYKIQILLLYFLDYFREQDFNLVSGCSRI